MQQTYHGTNHQMNTPCCLQQHIEYQVFYSCSPTVNASFTMDLRSQQWKQNMTVNVNLPSSTSPPPDISSFNEGSDSSFDAKVAELKEEWIKRESGSTGERFYDYFSRFIASDMKQAMITPVRKRARVPDSSYHYNNDNESTNPKIKRKVQRKRNDWPAFVAILKEKELAQNRNVDRSLFDEGPYRLKMELIALGASSNEFSTMTSHEERAVIKNFITLSLRALLVSSLWPP